jgi:hypothetical protein
VSIFISCKVEWYWFPFNQNILKYEDVASEYIKMQAHVRFPMKRNWQYSQRIEIRVFFTIRIHHEMQLSGLLYHRQCYVNIVDSFNTECLYKCVFIRLSRALTHVQLVRYNINVTEHRHQCCIDMYFKDLFLLSLSDLSPHLLNIFDD